MKLTVAVEPRQFWTLWAILRSLLSLSMTVPEDVEKILITEKITLTSVYWSPVSELMFVGQLVRRFFQKCKKSVLGTLN